MKHPPVITTLLVFLFVAAQLTGLGLMFLHGEQTVEDGKVTVAYGETAIGERPDASPEEIFFLLALGVGVGTGILLLLIKFKAFTIWKVWFVAAVFLSLFIAFEVVTPEGVAFSAALVLALWKVLRPSPIVHNATELFIYSGIVILVAPLFNLLWVCILLLAISLYDMYAVWKSKHMVTLAKASTANNLMAGLYLPKRKMKKTKVPAPPSPKKHMAVLGGGDIAFPLLFSSVVMTWLVNSQGMLPLTALYSTLIITLTCTVSLALLFAYGKKGKFYPAMPFLSLGCFVGLGILMAGIL